MYPNLYLYSLKECYVNVNSFVYTDIFIKGLRLTTLTSSRYFLQ